MISFMKQSDVNHIKDSANRKTWKSEMNIGSKIEFNPVQELIQTESKGAHV